MKYSLFSVSVPDMTPEEALQKMKEYGYDGVDWRVKDIPKDPEILGPYLDLVHIKNAKRDMMDM